MKKLLKKYREQIEAHLSGSDYITCPSCGRGNLENFKCLYRDCAEEHQELWLLVDKVNLARELEGTLDLLKLLKKEKLL